MFPIRTLMTGKKKKALYALIMLVLLGCGLIMFIIAADEQSVISSGLPAADRIRLQDLITQGPGKNKHVELVDFYFGKRFSSKLFWRSCYLLFLPHSTPASEAGAPPTLPLRPSLTMFRYETECSCAVQFTEKVSGLRHG